MFVLFLDIDGVLVTEQSYFYWEQRGDEPRKETDASRFCPIAVSNLNYLCANVPELLIVISSSWRTYYSLAQIQSFLEEEGFLHGDRLIDVTQVLSLRGNDRRYREISSWLEEERTVGVKDWVAIDDHDYNIPEEHLCLTPQEVGFTIDHAYTLIQRFMPEWQRPIFLM